VAVSDDDPKAMAAISAHLDPKFEPFNSARYWALEGLIRGGKVANEQVRKVAAADHDLAGRLAAAFLASRGDREARKEILDDLKDWESSPKAEPTIRSLRVVFLPGAVPLLSDVVRSMAFLGRGIRRHPRTGSGAARVPSTPERRPRRSLSTQSKLTPCRGWTACGPLHCEASER
jgi:hypothetical protein